MIKKIKEYFENMHEHFAPFLSNETIGLYYQLLWMEHDEFNGNSIPIHKIAKLTRITQENVYSHALVLEECELIEFSKRKNAIYISQPKKRTKEDDLILLERLCQKGIISPHKGQSIAISISDIEKQKQVKITKEAQPKTFNFEEQEISAVSPMSLVNYYYRYLSETFGGDFTSHNSIVETATLKRIMEHNNDSAEDTKKMFRFLIDKAKEKGRLDAVSTMGLYSRKRNDAYYHVFVAPKAIEEALRPIQIDEAQKLVNVKESYEYYAISKGLGHDAAIEQLRRAFDAAVINRFLEGLNEKQVSVHQGRM